MVALAGRLVVDATRPGPPGLSHMKDRTEPHSQKRPQHAKIATQRTDFVKLQGPKNAKKRGTTGPGHPSITQLLPLFPFPYLASYNCQLMAYIIVVAWSE